ncbi:TPA: DUF1883 domain-containing protein [Citrobacter freundii]
MQFTHYDLRQLKSGQVVEVNLAGNAANVMLMNNNNFLKYRSGRASNYYGGHVTSSVTRLRVPSSGHWHIAIDLGGYAGTVRSSVNVY